MKKKKSILDSMKPPKGCDWNFLCGYLLAMRHAKELLARKKRKEKPMIKDVSFSEFQKNAVRYFHFVKKAGNRVRIKHENGTVSILGRSKSSKATVKKYKKLLSEILGKHKGV